MNNKPFIFNDEADKNKVLLTELENIGLSLDGIEKDYLKEIWSMSCPWKLNDNIELIWKRSNWSDGNFEEDESLELVVNNNVFSNFDIAISLRQKLEKPLRQTIIDNIKAMAMNYTGKKIEV